MKDLILITYFKNYFRLLELFINYYARFWKVDHIFLCMGYTEEKYAEKIFARVEAIKGMVKIELREKNFKSSKEIYNVCFHDFKNKKEKYKLTFLTYKTSSYISRNVFDKKIKTELCKLSNSHAAGSNKNIMVVDSDEYYYSRDVASVIMNRSEIFHFIELVPQDNFDLRNNLYFCIKPWFYIHDFVDYDTCKLCKKIVFERRNFKKVDFNIKMLHRHNLNKNDCIVCRTYQNCKDVKKLLFNNNFCFHMSILDQEYLFENKVKQGFNDSIIPKINKNYNNIFRKDKTQILKINFLKRYIKS